MALGSGDDSVSPKELMQGERLLSVKSLSPVVDAGQYARCNGLTIDSLVLDWQQLIGQDQAIASTLAGVEPGHLIEDLQLQECLFRVIIPTAEQWQMPAVSLQILQQVCRARKENEVADLASQQCFLETHERKRLKLEPPALRSDHWTDCRRLARRVKAFFREPLPDHRLPLDPVDIDKGEGLKFPKSATAGYKDQIKIMEQENPEVAKDTVVYLMQSLKSELTDADRRDFVESVSAYHGLNAREHLTPPLSPLLAAPPEYYIPENESCNIPEPSDLSSTLSEDIKAAESKIFESEYEFWAEVLNNDDSPGRYDDMDVSEMIRAGEFRPPVPPPSLQPVSRDLKVDVPLLRYSDNGGHIPETAKILNQDDLAEAKELVASSDTLSGSDGPTGRLVALFQRSATVVTRHAEQEKLHPLDATARVPVPILDFSIPVPEWENRFWEAKAMFCRMREDINVDWQGAKWAYNRSAEQRMVWAPLAHMEEKRLVSERIEVGIEVLEALLKRVPGGEVFTSADYVYKERGPAVFRMADDEDEDEDYLMPLSPPKSTPSDQFQNIISCTETASSMTESALALQSSSPFTSNTATPPHPADLTSLLRGRKRQIDETLYKRQSSGNQARPVAATSEISATDIIDSALVPSTNVLKGFMSEYTDFGPLVDNFVAINFPKKPKLTHSSYFAPTSTPPSTLSQSKADEAAKLMPPPPKPIPALAPDITPPSIPPRIVISSTITKPLTQHLENLLPAIELIPRNPDKHRPPGGALDMRSPCLDEADIVVSPATGILLTTMIKLRQRALPLPGPPGQSAAPANTTAAHATTFCRVVANVAVRHERLVVLVSEENKHSETASPLSQSDARALAEFQGFAAGLRTTTAAADVRALYVGGGVETLARWVAATVCEYAGEAAAVREMLLPVETFWEVFLRRAGMNVFAAQVVLGRLKVPDGRSAVGGGDGQVFGLPWFIMMSKHKRIELFEEALGGRRVLDRVSEVIDEPWGQQAVENSGFGSAMAPLLRGLHGGKG